MSRIACVKTVEKDYTQSIHWAILNRQDPWTRVAASAVPSEGTYFFLRDEEMRFATPVISLA